jgi:transcription elongation factor Elf1
MKKDKELVLLPYTKKNGIIIYCKNCGSEFEETANGYYEPIKYETDKTDRECNKCLIELGVFS